MSKHILHGKHARRDRWGQIRLPSLAYRAFKDLRTNGFYHPLYTWQLCCAAYRKKIHKMRISKASRRRNRRR